MVLYLDLVMLGRVAFEGLIALMGVLFMVASWVMDFRDKACRPLAGPRGSSESWRCWQVPRVCR